MTTHATVWVSCLLIKFAVGNALLGLDHENTANHHLGQPLANNNTMKARRLLQAYPSLCVSLSCLACSLAAALDCTPHTTAPGRSCPPSQGQARTSSRGPVSSPHASHASSRGVPSPVRARAGASRVDAAGTSAVRNKRCNAVGLRGLTSRRFMYASLSSLMFSQRFGTFTGTAAAPAVLLDNLPRIHMHRVHSCSRTYQQ